MSSQAAVALLKILAEVDRMDAHPHAKHHLKTAINEHCLAAGIKIVDRSERVQFARRLLDDGEPRPIIRDRLMIRFGIEKTMAYDAIGRALKLSKSAPKYWTNEAQNSITDSTNSTQD